MKADEIVRMLLDETCIHNDRHAKAGCSRCVQDAFVTAQSAAREEGRAAGYAEAKEQAAKVADDQCEAHWEAARQCSAEGDSKGDIQQMKCGRTCEIISSRIRALAPATTKEPK